MLLQPKEYECVENSELVKGTLKMQEKALSDQQEGPKVEIKTATVGSRLREERLSKGIKTAEIAERLHITNHYVKALESNNFDKLPSTIFIKGYLKNYADLLGLNPSEIIGLYEKAISQNEEIAGASVPRQNLKTRNRHFVVLSVILFIVFFTGLWVYESVFGETSSLNLTGGTTRNGIQKLQFATMPAASEHLSKTVSGSYKKGNNPSIQSNKGSVLYRGEPDRIIGFSSQGADKLDILFYDESWIEIMDAPQNKPFREIMTSGNTLQVRGVAPFYILVADATVARIKFNGVEIELTDKIRIDNSASLILGM